MGRSKKLSKIELVKKQVNLAKYYVESYYCGYQYGEARNCIRKALEMDPNLKYGFAFLVTIETLFFGNEFQCGNKPIREIDWYSLLHLNFSATTSEIECACDYLFKNMEIENCYFGEEFQSLLSLAENYITEARYVLCDANRRLVFDQKRVTWGLVDSEQNVCAGYYDHRQVFREWKPPIFIDTQMSDVEPKVEALSVEEEQNLSRFNTRGLKKPRKDDVFAHYSGEEVHSSSSDEDSEKSSSDNKEDGVASEGKRSDEEVVNLVDVEQTSAQDGGFLANRENSLSDEEGALSVEENYLGIKEPNAPAQVSEGVSVEESSTESFKDLQKQVFEAMPQKPHFKPLKNYHGIVLQGMIDGLDNAFVSLSEKIRGLVGPQSLRAGLKDLKEELIELEVMGYDVSMLRERLDELQGIAKREEPNNVAAEEFKADILKEEEKRRLLRLRILEIYGELNKSETVSDNRKRKIEQLESDTIMVVDEFKSVAKSPWK